MAGFGHQLFFHLTPGHSLSLTEEVDIREPFNTRYKVRYHKMSSSSNNVNASSRTVSSSASSTTSSSSNGASDYFSYQPAFQPNFHIRERAPRHTTITTRELRFPSGCDCHPTKSHKHTNSYARYGSPVASWQAHGRPEYIERNSSRDSRTSINSVSSSSSSGGAARRFAGLFRRTSSG